MGERDSTRAKLVPRDPPLVTVRFRQGSVPSWGAEATSEVAKDPDADWARLSLLFPGLTVAPLFDNVPEQVIKDVVARAQRMTPTFRRDDYLAMFRVKLPPIAQWGQGAPKDGNLAAALRDILLQSLSIDRVSVETLLAPPPLRDSGSAGAWDLLHLNPAPRGLDAQAAWDEAGGKAEGEVLADVERGWLTTHEEFAGVVFDELAGGEQIAEFVPHGTNVLSVAIAREDAKNVIGVAPMVTDVVLASEKRVGVVDYVTEAAIMDVIVELVTSGRKPGSVLLIEVQKYLYDFDDSVDKTKDFRRGPAEMAFAVFALIQLAVALHIVVVEAAGNGGSEAVGSGGALDLDGYAIKGLPMPGKKELMYGDSGAILVGQSYWNDTTGAAGNFHTVVPDSCTGARIDCFAVVDDPLGAGVVAASPGGTASGTYAGGFKGTSAASAMIAGAALAVQGMMRSGAAGPPGYLTPPRMRALLGNKVINTPLSLLPGTDVIGVMPNLAAIFTKLSQLPDLYLRDNVTDRGDPHDGHLSRSPDIIVKNAPLPAGTTPDAAFGEDSGTEFDEYLSDKPVAGKKAWVYVRVRNRGKSDATGATVTVWYADSGTLLHPLMWTRIGDPLIVTLVDVPQGDTLKVAGPIEWPAVPTTGHYCFIALVHHADDPGFLSTTFSIPPTTELSIPTEFNDFEYFKLYIRNSNNVAWRNFDVISVPPSGGSVTALAASVAGAETGDGGEMEFRVDARLPHGATLHVELPEKLAAVMKLRGRFTVDRAAAVRRATVAPVGLTHLGRARLAAGTPHVVTLRVNFPRGLEQACEVSLIQLHHGQVIGRVTWSLKPEVSA